MNPLVDFYLGGRPDHRGRPLAEILEQDDGWLESTHDYIQWLFPLREPSRAVPGAPTLDAAAVTAFLEDESLRRRLRASFERMLSFYGLAWRDGTVVKGDNWRERKDNWFTEPTHNDLRITRILTSLAILGLRPESEAFLAGLERLRVEEGDCGVSEETWAYWRKARLGE